MAGMPSPHHEVSSMEWVFGQGLRRFGDELPQDGLFWHETENFQSETPPGILDDGNLFHVYAVGGDAHEDIVENLEDPPVHGAGDENLDTGSEHEGGLDLDVFEGDQDLENLGEDDEDAIF